MAVKKSDRIAAEVAMEAIQGSVFLLRERFIALEDHGTGGGELLVELIESREDEEMDADDLSFCVACDVISDVLRQLAHCVEI